MEYVTNKDSYFFFSYSNKQIKLKFPQEHPLSSHMSRQEMFPRPEPTIPCDPLSEEEDTLPAMNSSLPHVPGSTVVTQKVMGNFARREVFTPQKSTLRKPLISNDRQKIERLQVRGNRLQCDEWIELQSLNAFLTSVSMLR